MSTGGAHGLRLIAAAALLLACAAEEQDANVDADGTSDGGRSLSLGGTAAGRAGAASSGGQTAHGGQATSAAGVASHGGSSGSGGSNVGAGGSTSSGGKTSSGGAGGSAGAAAGNGGTSGTLGNAGQAGGPNQPTTCDEATATVLGSMSSNVTVASNACLKISLPTDQTWIKKITLQPEAGVYPLPFSWSNCGTNSTGAFAANYTNVVLNPVTAECPILVKLAGSGGPINVQWWGG